MEDKFTKQPKAEREYTELEKLVYGMLSCPGVDLPKAAAELARLRAERDALLNALELIDHLNAGYVSEIAREACAALAPEGE